MIWTLSNKILAQRELLIHTANDSSQLELSSGTELPNWESIENDIEMAYGINEAENRSVEETDTDYSFVYWLKGIWTC